MKYKLVAHQRGEEPNETNCEKEYLYKTTSAYTPLCWIEVDGISVRITRSYGKFARWILRRFFGIKVHDC